MTTKRQRQTYEKLCEQCHLHGLKPLYCTVCFELNRLTKEISPIKKTRTDPPPTQLPVFAQPVPIKNWDEDIGMIWESEIEDLLCSSMDVSNSSIEVLFDL
jgi:hypothetical protein